MPKNKHKLSELDVTFGLNRSNNKNAKPDPNPTPRKKIARVAPQQVRQLEFRPWGWVWVRSSPGGKGHQPISTSNWLLVYVKAAVIFTKYKLTRNVDNAILWHGDGCSIFMTEQ